MTCRCGNSVLMRKFELLQNAEELEPDEDLEPAEEPLAGFVEVNRTEIESRARDPSLGASGRSPTKKLSIVKQRVRVHGRRLSWLLGWHRSVDRSVLGCVLRASAGVAERRRARV